MTKMMISSGIPIEPNMTPHFRNYNAGRLPSL